MRHGLVPAALLALLLLLLNPSSGVFAAPSNGSAAIAKAASEKEVPPAPEDPRDADGEEDDCFLSSPSWPLCKRPSESSRESAFFHVGWPQLLSLRIENIGNRRSMRFHSEKETLKRAHCSFF